MRLTYDSQANAAYISLKDIAPSEVATTVPCLDEAGRMINLDYDSRGHLLGIEILDARHVLPPEVIESQL